MITRTPQNDGYRELIAALNAWIVSRTFVILRGQVDQWRNCVCFQGLSIFLPRLRN